MKFAENFFRSTAVIASLLAAGCQGHLPPLHNEPYVGEVTPADITGDINCELATIESIGYLATNEATLRIELESALQNKKLKKYSDAYERTLRKLQSLAAVQANSREGHGLGALLHYLTDYHFVAAVQLTLDVTDAEGLVPTLNKIKPLTGANNRMLTLGGQLNGTQDRTMTLSNSIDFEALQPKFEKNGIKTFDPVDAYCAKLTPSSWTEMRTTLGLNGALLGDLGLAEIIVSGMRSLDDSAKINLYGGSGPVRPAETDAFDFDFSVMGGKDPLNAVRTGAFKGSLVFSPPAVGSLTPETATLVGTLTLSGMSSGDLHFLVNVPGVVISTTSASDSGSQDAEISLQGALAPLAPYSTNPSLPLGTAPTLVVTGRAVKGALAQLKVSGILTSTTPLQTLMLGETYPTDEVLQSEGSRSIASTTFSFSPATTGLSAGAKSGGASSGSGASSTTSFGSTINFILAYGLNGGPNWSLTHFRGPSPSAPLLTATRTETNTLNVTFVPACKSPTKTAAQATLIVPRPTDFWSSLGQCDAENVDVGAAAAAANQNNLFLKLH